MAKNIHRFGKNIYQPNRKLSFVLFAIFLLLMGTAYASAQNFNQPSSPDNFTIPFQNPDNPLTPRVSPDNNNDNATGNVIRTIKIVGAAKIAPATIVAYLPFKVGDRWSNQLGNQAAATLNNTGQFNFVTIDEDNGVVTITITESRLIDQIAFEGNDEVEDATLLQVLGQFSPIRVQGIYSRSSVKKAVNVIQQVYLQQGFFKANVSPKLIDIGGNKVQLVFEIVEGDVPKIHGFQFYGNDSFADSSLQSRLASSTYNPIRFFNDTDRYSPVRIETDKANIARFYQERGFSEVEVVSAITQLSKDKDSLTVTFTINEGVRYRLNSVKLESNIKELPLEKLQRFVHAKKDAYYNIAEIEKTQRDLVNTLRLEYNYPFMQVDATIVPNPKNKETLDIKFDISPAPKRYLNRLVIRGNGRTLDSIIRRNFSIAEGDPLDENAIAEGVQDVQNTGFFSAVNSEIVQVSGDRYDVIINVEETSTGALNFSAGYSSRDGIIFGITFSENNLLGTARVITLSGQFAIPVTKEQGRTFNQSYNFAYTEPFLGDSDVSMTTSAYRFVTETVATNIEQTRTGGSIGFRFNYDRDWSHYLYYNIYFDELRPAVNNLAGLASLYGNRLSSIIGHQISFDTRDNPNDPRQGIYSFLSNDLAGLGGNNYYFRSLANITTYLPMDLGLASNPFFALGIEGGYIFPFNNRNVPSINRFTLGGSTLRGFQESGIGPVFRTNNNRSIFLGGRYYFSQSIELRIPIDALSDLGAKFLIFNDIGLIGRPEEINIPNVIDSNGLRASWGVGGSFITPIGPIVISWGFPYAKGQYDIIERFRFDFQSRF